MDIERIRTNLANSILMSGLTHDQFAKEAGLSQPCISGFIARTTMPHESSVAKMLDAMERLGWLNGTPSCSYEKIRTLLQVKLESERYGIKEFAGIANILYPTLYNFVRADTKPRPSTLKQIVDAMDSLGWLHPEEEVPDIGSKTPGDNIVIIEENPSDDVSTLTQDERIQCIKLLPEPIIKKLFPHI